MTPKWPEKLDDSAVYFGADAKYYDGYNAARDDCIKAWEDSPKLVHLPLDEIKAYLQDRIAEILRERSNCGGDRSFEVASYYLPNIMGYLSKFGIQEGEK